MNDQFTEKTSLAEQVNAIFLKCLYGSEELIGSKMPKGQVIAAGIINNYGFHPGRLAANREKIRAILDQMPEQFHRSKGGGWSFLNLCMTKDGQHWAEHPTMEEIVVLAIASGMGGYAVMPRMMWPALPGGMPYVWFDTEPKQPAGEAA